jgi:LytS/YehU family sensor histidine kinase
MIIHTLIENGLTHSYEPTEPGNFELLCENYDHKRIICLRNNGSLLRSLSQKAANDIEEGMGMRYVKARLEESYSGRWDLQFGLVNDLWEVTIYISE